MATVRCPNCGTSFETVRENDRAIRIPSNFKGTGYLIPKEIRNDNIKTTTEYGKNNNYEEEKKENGTMMNNMNNLTNNDIETIANIVAERMQKRIDNISDNRSQQYNRNVSTPVIQDEDKNHWAMNSQFKGKMICGYIYNPYTVRRWLVAQYKKMFDEYKSNVHRGITEIYSYDYSVDYTRKEIAKLAMLEKRDPIAFPERSLCFPKEQCRKIMIKYCEDILDWYYKKITEGIRDTKVGKEVAIKISGYGSLKAGTVTEVIDNHKVRKNIDYSDDHKVFVGLIKGYKESLRCLWRYNYNDLNKVVSEMKHIKIDSMNKEHPNFRNWMYRSEMIKKSPDFMDCFIKSGAYYTIKQEVMFEDGVFKGKAGRNGVDAIRAELNRKHPGYVYHAMWKEMIGYNRRSRY